MKIGLFTIYHVPNYGSVLQTFATQSLFEKLGVRCSIINYKYPNDWHYKHGFKKPSLKKKFLLKIKPTAKNIVLNSFRKRYFNFTRLYKNIDELIKENWDSYDAFVVGSDQVWNHKYMLGDSAFLLSFVPINKKRYSLASSFSLQSLSDQFVPKYREELLKFTALSVREINGVNIINNQLNIDKKVKVVLDPTLLLSKNDWLSRFCIREKRRMRPYILFYMLTYAFETRPYIFEVTKYFQKKYNCDVLALEGYEKPENSNALEMYDVSASSIPEFINLFVNAEMVVTSSFHGTAFAVNFGIPLISIVPENSYDDRQSSLLKRLHLDNCIIKVNSDIDAINPQYDIIAEQNALQLLRDESISWITNNIITE